MKIILGSKSPFRRALFERIVPEFECMSADIEEQTIRSDDFERLPLLLANAKAEALLSVISEPAILVTCDQVVVCREELREKPVSKEQARQFLRSYSLLPAQTNSAIVVTNTLTNRRFEGIDIARAFFKPIPKTVIEELIEEGKVLHTAGGFLIEDPLLAPYVDRIEGSIDSIMGLPLALTVRLMEQASAD